MILTLAARNVLRQKRRSLFTILTMVGGLALAAITIGWVDGSYNYLIDVFTRNITGHLQVHAAGYLDRPSLYKTVDGYDSVGRVIERNRSAKAWAPRLYAAGLAAVGDKSTAAEITGIDPGREQATLGFAAKVKRGSPLADTAAGWAVVGKGLAGILKAGLDSTVVVASQAADGSIANDQYRVCGIIETGDEQADRMALYLHIGDAQRLLVLEGRAHELIVVAASLGRTDGLTRDLRQQLRNGNLDVQPWQVVARAFYQSMEADKKGHTIMFLVIMLIVAVGVLNTVLMSVLERTREYGVLRAVGTRPGQIFRMVVAEVIVLALVSVVVGTLAGLAGNWLLSLRGIKFPPTDVGGITFDTMKGEITAKSIYLPALLVLFSSFLVSVFPARRAAGIEPAKAMRIH
ncbi:MAG: FtsX-like permease family protein [Candidatus Edwardsbacteria bacterium]|nr:FtsX-like permease family protein [Candidatus Edwardsbacteria bacterium]